MPNPEQYGHSMRRENPETGRIIESAETKIFDGALSDIIEVTYAYTKTGERTFFNRTVFSDFAGVDSSENIEKAFHEAARKLSEKRADVAEHRAMISALAKELRSDRIEILEWTLKYVDALLKVAEIGLPFEAEKAGRPHGMDDEEVEASIAEMEALEKVAFWGNLRDDDEERRVSLESLEDDYVRGGWRLSHGERTKFARLYEKIGGGILSEIGHERLDEVETTQNFPLDRPVKRESYMEAFRRVFAFYGIDKPVVCDERSSIFDGEDALHVPSSEEYSTLPVSRVLALIQHEIETHYVITKNNERVLGKFRGGGNLEREEGVAVIAEGILSGESIEKFARVRTNPQIYAGEILAWGELWELISLMKKMDGQPSSDPSSLLLRRKRNYPMGHRWVQHKDTSYPRGERKTARYVLDWGDVRDLYVAKVSFEDVERAKRIAKSEGIKIVYPILIGEVLARSLSGKTTNREEIFTMIRKKYPFLHEWLDESGRTETEVKRKVVGILRAIRGE